MPGRAKPPFGIQFGRKMAAIIGKITVLAKSFIFVADEDKGKPRSKDDYRKKVQSRRKLSERATGVGYLSTR